VNENISKNDQLQCITIAVDRFFKRTRSFDRFLNTHGRFFIEGSIWCPLLPFLSVLLRVLHFYYFFVAASRVYSLNCASSRIPEKQPMKNIFIQENRFLRDCVETEVAYSSLFWVWVSMFCLNFTSKTGFVSLFQTSMWLSATRTPLEKVNYNFQSWFSFGGLLSSCDFELSRNDVTQNSYFRDSLLWTTYFFIGMFFGLVRILETAPPTILSDRKKHLK